MSKLNSKHLSFKCPLKWSDLEHTENGHHCHQCKNQVFDLTDCSLEDATKLQKKHGTICGLVPVLGASAMLTFASCKTEPPPTSKFSGKCESYKIEKNTQNKLPPLALGIICPIKPENDHQKDTKEENEKP